MYQVPGNESVLITRVVTDQILEGFSYLFDLYNSGKIGEESVMDFCLDSEALGDLVRVCQTEGFAIVQSCLQEMYRMLTDLQYAYSFNLFGQLILNEIVEECQEEEDFYDIMERDFPRLAQALGEECFPESWYTTRGTDLIRVREYFTALSKEIFAPLTQEKEEARRAWVREQVAVHTNLRRMWLLDEEGSRVLFSEDIDSIYDLWRDGFPGLMEGKLERELCSGRREIPDLDAGI